MHSSNQVYGVIRQGRHMNMSMRMDHKGLSIWRAEQVREKEYLLDQYVQEERTRKSEEEQWPQVEQ